MSHSFPIYVGLRYLRAKRRNNFISLISGVSMVGLTLGVMVLIIVMSVMNGFDSEMRNRILGMVAHVEVSIPGKMTNQNLIMDEALNHPLVLGASPYVKTPGMAVANNRTNEVLVTGIDPETIHTVSELPKHIVSGSIADLVEQPRGVLVGESMSWFLNIDVGDKLTLFVPVKSEQGNNIQTRLKSFTVVGTFRAGAEVDGNLVVTHIKDLSELMRYNGAIDGVRIKTVDIYKVRQVSADLKSHLSEPFTVSDWTETHGSLFQSIEMEKKLVGLLLFVIIIVAVFNVLSTLVMLVMDKQSEIAVLRTLGATSGQVLGIFIVQGTAIGVIGTGLGVGLGVIGALTITDLIFWIETTLGVEFIDSSVFIISHLPSELRWGDVVLIATSTFIISIIATIYPARKASKILPAEALRYES